MNRFTPAMFARSAGESRYPQLWRGCVGAWCPSLGPTGATLRDWSGRANYGTLNSFTLANAWVPSYGQYELKFDGVDDYVTIPRLAGLTAALTIAMWIRPVFSVGMNQYLLDTTIANVHAIQIYDGDDNNGFPKVAYNAQLGAAATDLPTSSIYYHVAFTSSGSAISVFLNGKLNWTVANVALVPEDFILGASVGLTAGRFFQGGVDDLRIYNRPLSGAEVQFLYSAGRAGAYAMRERRRVSVATAGGMLLQRRRMCA